MKANLKDGEELDWQRSFDLSSDYYFLQEIAKNALKPKY